MEPGKKMEQQKPYTQTLNVLFHGLWAYELMRDKEGREWIEVRTPPEPDHRVAAGSWIPEEDLLDGATYMLEGIQPGDDSNFDPRINVVFTDRKLVQTAPVRCTIRLPLPRRISSLRPIAFHKDKPPYTGSHAGMVKTREISIVQVFSYCASLRDVRLVSDGVPKKVHEVPLLAVKDGQEVANFYLFAQPDGRVQGSHFETAFKKLAAMYGLDIVPVPSIAPGPRTPDDLPGVGWRDVVGLNERAMFLGELVPAAGSSGSNCDPFIVDNLYRTPPPASA